MVIQIQRDSGKLVRGGKQLFIKMMLIRQTQAEDPGESQQQTKWGNTVSTLELDVPRQTKSPSEILAQEPETKLSLD